MLTFTPDNRALNGMPGCGLCGINGQVLSPVLADGGAQVVVEVDPGVFYAQMANDYAAAAAEVDEHMENWHPAVVDGQGQPVLTEQGTPVREHLGVPPEAPPSSE